MAPSIEVITTNPESNINEALSISVPDSTQFESTPNGYRFVFPREDVSSWVDALILQVRIDKSLPSYPQAITAVVSWIKTRATASDWTGKEKMALSLRHDEATISVHRLGVPHLTFGEQETLNGTFFALLPQLGLEDDEDFERVRDICTRLGILDEPQIQEAISLVFLIELEKALNLDGPATNIESREDRLLAVSDAVKELIAGKQNAMEGLTKIAEALGLEPSSSDDSITVRCERLSNRISEEIENGQTRAVREAVVAVLEALGIKPINLTSMQRMEIDLNLGRCNLPQVARDPNIIPLREKEKIAAN